MKVNTAAKVPAALRLAFLFHFWADLVFALPLFFFPVGFLTLLSWPVADPVAARLVAAALFAVGGKSYIERNAGIAVYRSMLSLKIIWSFFATVGLFYSLVSGEFGSQLVGSALTLIFFSFHLLWWYWYRRLSSLS